MAAPRKPGKTDALRETRENAPQRREDGPQRDFAAYRESDTVTVSTRLDRADRDRIDRYAAERGIKAAQLVRLWILEAMNREGIR